MVELKKLKNDEITIDTYKDKYHTEIINLILGIQQNEFHVPISLQDQPDLINIPKFYQTRNGQFWVALYNNRVVGTLGLLDIGNRQGVLRKMFVETSFRGSQIGTAKILLNELIK
ncbi:MAG: GNAT family N-acetyltransferase [archaeon]